MDRAREALASLVHCEPHLIAPVTNATVGVATVFANIRLAPGDEVLVTSHEYPACVNNARAAAERAGAKLVTARIPFPCPSPEAVIDAILAAVTPRTTIALISHVTSGSGMVLPVERLVLMLEARGVRTLIDGAHAIGMLPLRLQGQGGLNAAYYVTNCHKWLCTPKGSAMLLVREEFAETFRPLVLSNNAHASKPGRSQFLTEFDYLGTSDLSPFMVIPEAIEILSSILPGQANANTNLSPTASLEPLMRHNRAAVLAARDTICQALGVPAPCPASMVGSIATIILPPHEPALAERLAARPSAYHDALQDVLLKKYRLQIPVWGAHVLVNDSTNEASSSIVLGSGTRWLRCCRVSAQAYNAPEQYAYAAQAIKAELEFERAGA